MSTEATGLGLTEVLAAHRRNGPVDDPGMGLPPAYWRAKCDGEDCDFYIEAPTYWRACKAHDEHLAERVRVWLREALVSPEVVEAASRGAQGEGFYGTHADRWADDAWQREFWTATTTAALAAAAETLGAT